MSPRLQFLFLSCLFPLILCSDPLKNPALNPVTVHAVPQHEAIELVKDGELRFAIVIDGDRPGVFRHPANTLADAFYRCTGRVPAILTHKQKKELAEYPVRIAVGKSPLTEELAIDILKLPKGGFVVQTSKNLIAIAGYDSRCIPGFATPENGNEKIRINGTLHGVYDFMERFLGVRIYLPGEFGSVWPKIASLVIPPLHYSDYPRVQNVNQGWFIHTGFAAKKRWGKLFGPDFDRALPAPAGISRIADRTRMSDAWRCRIQEPYRAIHSPHPQRVGKLYPDRVKELFFRGGDGKIYYNGTSVGSYFDITNLGFADFLIEEWKRFFSGKESVFGTRGKADSDIVPNRQYLAFGQCDADVPQFDMLANPVVRSLRLLENKNGYSEIHSRFVIHLAKRIQQEFPGAKLSIMPYANYTSPPRMSEYRRFPDNVEIQICAGNLPGMIRNPRIRAGWEKRFREWREVLGGRPIAGVWLYSIPNNPFARAVVPEFTGETIKAFGNDTGKLELFFDYYGSLEWCYYYASYVMYRSLWNCEFNIDAALDEHWNLFYGAVAGGFLKKFHECLRENFLKYVVKQADNNALYPSAELDKMEKLLAEAEKSIPENSVEKKRFVVFSEPWRKAFQGQRARQGYQRPVYHIRRLPDGQVPVLDGVPDEKFWKNAEVMSLRDPNGMGSVPSDGASFHLLWNDLGIWGYCSMEYPPLANPEKTVWENCNIEMFLSPGKRFDDYFHYAVDAANHLYTASRVMNPIEQPYNAKWQSPQFRAGVKITDKSWCVEFFLPFADLKKNPPRAYEGWYGNFVRTRIAGQREFHSSSLTVGNNHNLSQFGILKFLGKGD